jgi:predicted phage terminase large subunit-like protein
MRLAELLATATPQTIEALIWRDFSLFVQVMWAEVHPDKPLIWHPYLDLICAKLEAVAHGEIRNLIITMPPRHMKSTCVSVALSAYVLGHYPEEEVMCVSYGADLAKEFAAASLQMMQCPAYVNLFGPVLSSARPPLHLLKTRGGGARRATSLDGTATGVGSDLLIFDDPQKPGETLSEAIRRTTNNAYEHTFLSRRNMPAKARTVIVMQRLHEDDFVGHVLGLGGDWEILNLPAIAEEDQVIPYKTIIGDHVYRRREGEALHPVRMPLEELALIREASGEAVWSTQYQQRPAPAGGGLVNTGAFVRYATQDLPERFDRKIQSWDTAATVAEWSAYSVCTTWGIKGKKIYLLHVWRKKVQYPELRSAVVEQATLHDADIVYLEEHSSGIQLLQDLPREGFGKLRGVKPVRDKATRMINQTALIENGFVHIPEEAPWLADYLHELAMFPNSKFWDQIDSTSQALDHMHKGVTPEEWAELLNWQKASRPLPEE